MRLERIRPNPETIQGHATDTPKIGERLQFFGKNVSIMTSVITEVSPYAKHTDFLTKSGSFYRLHKA